MQARGLTLKAVMTRLPPGETIGHPWPCSNTAPGIAEDDDADLADELLVGFEEGAP